MWGILTGHDKENPPPLFEFVFFYVMVGSLMKSPIWNIVFLLDGLGVLICVVHVRVFLDVGVGIHGGRWGNTLACRGQLFFYHHIYSLV